MAKGIIYSSRGEDEFDESEKCKVSKMPKKNIPMKKEMLDILKDLIALKDQFKEVYWNCCFGYWRLSRVREERTGVESWVITMGMEELGCWLS